MESHVSEGVLLSVLLSKLSTFYYCLGEVLAMLACVTLVVAYCITAAYFITETYFLGKARLWFPVMLRQNGLASLE